jgi:hypothetical protein
MVKHNRGAATSISVIVTHANYEVAQGDDVLEERVAESGVVERDGKY